MRTGRCPVVLTEVDRSSVAPAAPSKPKLSGGPSAYTVGRQLRETEQATFKAQRQVDHLSGQLATVTDHAELQSG